MKRTDLLRGILTHEPFEDGEITGVCSDSRKIVPGCVFVCIKGGSFDGHDHAEEALKAGASCVVCERSLGIPGEIVVENPRLAYAKMCAAWFGDPQEKMRFIGVTGTNGKTTVTSLIKGILMREGHKVGLIGTIQNEIGDEAVDTTHTTPDAHELYRLFAKMADAGCDVVVMEVTSHALHQHRIGEISFELGVFTNLTQDHLDYHGTMEEYFNAKKMMFIMTKTAIVNIDDPYGRRLAEETTCKVLSYSAKEPAADYYAKAAACLPSSVRYTLVHKGEACGVEFDMPGFFSVANSMAAAAVCIELGIPVNRTVAYLGDMTVKGRSEVIPTGRDFTVVCDYAHTPDGLENILPALKQNTKGRLVTLFGCGGDRDRTKRPLMGEAVARTSDFIIVTSDNPRSEDPVKIIDDILPGIEKYDTPYVVLPDRREAVFYAVSHAQKGDLIVLAGKGHEDYQVVDTGKIHFDEREIVAEALAAL